VTQTHTTQDQFLARIRKALGRSAPLAVAPKPPQIDDDLVRLAGPGDDLVGLFAMRAVEVGMIVHRINVDRLADTLAGLLCQLKVKTATLAVDRLPQSPVIRAAISSANVMLLEWAGDRTMRNQYLADAGITDVHAALAETGSLVCNSDAAHGRGHSLAPPIHFAIVRRSDILPDMLDYMNAIAAQCAGFGPASLPSAQAIITGPSKTADIEGILITGVHGPEQVHILLLQDA
jgi:L-lactate dehydrogenase complex protein LldG